MNYIEKYMYIYTLKIIIPFFLLLLLFDTLHLGSSQSPQSCFSKISFSSGKVTVAASQYRARRALSYTSLHVLRMSNTYFFPNVESSLNIEIIVPCQEQAINRFIRISIESEWQYLQIAYELGGDRAPHCFATVERVLLGDGTIQTAGGLTRI